MTKPESHKQDAWGFITALYAKPGVEAACLELQDRQGVNVTFLLFLKWCEASGQGGNDDWQTLWRFGRGWRLAAGFLRIIRRRTSGKMKRYLLRHEIGCEKRQLRHLEQAVTAGQTQKLVLAYLSAHSTSETGAAKIILEK